MYIYIYMYICRRNPSFWWRGDAWCLPNAAELIKRSKVMAPLWTSAHTTQFTKFGADARYISIPEKLKTWGGFGWRDEGDVESKPPWFDGKTEFLRDFFPWAIPLRGTYLTWIPAASTLSHGAKTMNISYQVLLEERWCLVWRLMLLGRLPNLTTARRNVDARRFCWTILGRLWGRLSFHHALTSQVPSNCFGSSCCHVHPCSTTIQPECFGSGFPSVFFLHFSWPSLGGRPIWTARLELPPRGRCCGATAGDAVDIFGDVLRDQWVRTG